MDSLGVAEQENAAARSRSGNQNLREREKPDSSRAP